MKNWCLRRAPFFPFFEKWIFSTPIVCGGNPRCVGVWMGCMDGDVLMGCMDTEPNPHSPNQFFVNTKTSSISCHALYAKIICWTSVGDCLGQSSPATQATFFFHTRCSPATRGDDYFYKKCSPATNVRPQPRAWGVQETLKIRNGLEVRPNS